MCLSLLVLLVVVYRVASLPGGVANLHDDVRFLMMWSCIPDNVVFIT